MFEVGRLCVKLAGRDAGKKCVVIEVLEKNYVLVDGETRRRKCNIMHLEPLNQVIDITDKASHETVISEFEKIDLVPRITKPRQKTVRPRQQRKTSEELRVQRAKKREEKKKEKEAVKDVKNAGIENKVKDAELADEPKNVKLPKKTVKTIKAKRPE